MYKESYTPPYTKLIFDFLTCVNFAVIVQTCSTNQKNLPNLSQIYLNPQTPHELGENYQYVFENLKQNGIPVLYEPEEFVAFPCHEILYLQLSFLWKKFKSA